MLYNISIYPIEFLYKQLYVFIYGLIGSWGGALIVLSVITTMILKPLMKWGSLLEKKERDLQKVLSVQLHDIKKQYKGIDRHNAIKRLFYRYSYNPVMGLRSALGVCLQLPFLIAAYYMLSSFENIQGVEFCGVIKDLSQADGLLYGINLLPILMTVINIVSTFCHKDFSKKDRIRSVVIAFMFFVLLYNASSSLLIYWTCNNLLGMIDGVIKVLISKYAFVEWIGYKVESIYCKTKSVLLEDSFCLILFFSTILFVFVPLDIYFVNSKELIFSLSNLFQWGLLFCVVSISLLYILCKLIPRKYRGFYNTVLSFLGFSFFIQSFLVNVNYGVLDGSKINWNKYIGYGILNTLSWILIFVVFWFIYKKIRNNFNKVRNVCIVVFFILLCSCIYSTNNTESVQSTYRPGITTNNIYKLSKNKNIIVLLLDAFDKDMFNEIISEHEEFKNDLQGFTHYPDVLPFFGLTEYSLPQILTDQIYLEDMPYENFITQAWQKDKFFRYLKDKNYNIGVYTENLFIAPNTVTLVDNLEYHVMKMNMYNVLLYSKLVAFRILPHFFKRFFVIYSGDFKYRNSDLYDMDDALFYQNLINKKLDKTFSNSVFRFYHFHGSHAPYTLNKLAQRVSPGDTNHKEQSIGVFRIVQEYLNQMKALNLYDSSTIIIMSDHGLHNTILTAPLMLVKYPYDQSEFKIDYKSISYKNLQATMLKNEDVSSFGDSFDRQKDDKSRIFYVVKRKVLDTLQKNSYLLALIKELNAKKIDEALLKFNVNGKVDLFESWKLVDVIKFNKMLTQEKKVKLYDLGTNLDFTLLGNSESFLISGWDRNVEKFGRWTSGKEAVLKMKMKNLNKNQNNLTLECLLSPYLTQEVEVYVNNTKIKTWDVKDSNVKAYVAEFPSTIVHKKDQVLTLKFVIPNYNKDPRKGGARKLGLFFNKLSIK